MTTAESPRQASESSTGEIISAVVRSLLGRDQVSYAAFAKVLGVSYPSLNRKVNGARPWTVREVEAIAEFFDESIASIYTGQGIELTPRRGSRGPGLDSQPTVTYSAIPGPGSSRFDSRIAAEAA